LALSSPFEGPSSGQQALYRGDQQPHPQVSSASRAKEELHNPGVSYAVSETSSVYSSIILSDESQSSRVLRLGDNTALR
jgi:hypothetical protein